mmetsp:Transcript_39128/g.116896  ORF Transcript_39128/g.116896 Transcript_39128/m.116896 type:complete len:310 (-) Transcript_39128:294-1223(-)
MVRHGGQDANQQLTAHEDVRRRVLQLAVHRLPACGRLLVRDDRAGLCAHFRRAVAGDAGEGLEFVHDDVDEALARGPGLQPLAVRLANGLEAPLLCDQAAVACSIPQEPLGGPPEARAEAAGEEPRRALQEPQDQPPRRIAHGPGPRQARRQEGRHCAGGVQDPEDAHGAQGRDDVPRDGGLAGSAEHRQHLGLQSGQALDSLADRPQLHALGDGGAPVDAVAGGWRLRLCGRFVGVQEGGERLRGLPQHRGSRGRAGTSHKADAEDLQRATHAGRCRAQEARVAAQEEADAGHEGRPQRHWASHGQQT